MEEQIAFATAAFGGFEKKQVLDYIYKMHEEVDEAQLKHRKKLEEISVAFKDLERRAQEAEKQSIQLKKELEQARQGTMDNTATVTNYENKINQLEQKVEQYERILTQRKQQALPEVGNSLELQNLQQQQQKIKAEYQRMEESSAKIGRVMLEAHSKAEQIVADAEKQAAFVVRQAQEAVEIQRGHINQVISQHRNKVQQESANIIARAQQEAKEIVSSAKQEREKIIAEADNYSVKLRSQVEQSAGTATQQLELLRQELNKLTLNTSDTLEPVKKIPTPQPTTTAYIPQPTSPLPYTTPSAPFTFNLDFPPFNDLPVTESEKTPIQPKADEFSDPYKAAEEVLSSYGGPDFDFELPTSPNYKAEPSFTNTPTLTTFSEPELMRELPSSPPPPPKPDWIPSHQPVDDSPALYQAPDKKVEYDGNQTDFATIQYAPSQLQEELNRQDILTYPSLNPPENQ